MFKNCNIVQPKSGNIKSLALLLHGLGSNGEDLIQLVPYLEHDMPDTLFLSPNGIESHDQSPYGYQWFSLLNKDLPTIQQKLEHNIYKIHTNIENKLHELNLGFDDLILLGFSQGTMVSLALNMLSKFKCIIGFSGVFILLTKTKNINNTPICMIHGKDDVVLPLSVMEQSIMLLTHSNNSNVLVREIPNLGHAIDARCIEIAVNFIKKYL